MSRLKPILVTAFAMLVLMLPLASAQGTETKTGGLFVNLTTDDTWSAAKAISFAHQRALKNGHRPVAIWLNVRAVYLADKKRPSHVHGLMRESGKSIQEMLKDFMADGGKVIMCSACSRASGLGAADYIDGVEMGTWPMIESILFDPNVTTLAW